MLNFDLLSPVFIVLVMLASVSVSVLLTKSPLSNATLIEASALICDKMLVSLSSAVCLSLAIKIDGALVGTILASTEATIDASLDDFDFPLAFA